MSNLSKKDLSRVSYVRPHQKSTISEIAEEMVFRANHFNTRVTSVFNDAQFVVDPGISVEKAVELWCVEFDRLHKRYKRSFKAELQRREFVSTMKKIIARTENIIKILKTEKIDILFLKRYSFYRELRPLGRSFIIFALIWAPAMQIELRNGKNIEEVAENLYHEYDILELSKYEFYMAVKFLVKHWKHGEKLRRWYNLFIAPGDLGKTANDHPGYVLVNI